MQQQRKGTPDAHRVNIPRDREPEKEDVSDETSDAVESVRPLSVCGC